MKVQTNKDYNAEKQKKLKVKKNTIIGIVVGLIAVFIFGAFFIVQEQQLVQTIKNESLSRLNTWFKHKGHNALGHKMSLRDNITKLQESITNIPAYYWNTLTSGNNDDLPQLYIDINFKRFQKLNAKRAEALQRGLLVKSEDDFVAAKIRYKNSTTKVKLRLKGDLTDHLEDDKWSLRIHTKGKSHLFSIRRFSIQNPQTRGLQGEVLFYETLSPFNIITPRYFFVNVVINGEDIGIMALEEHFSKELLEHNGRKEGVIIRFDESLLWDADDGKDQGFDGVFDSYLNADIDAFRSSKIRKSERLSKEYRIAVGLLRGFNSRELTASEVFDVEKMANYLAVSQFWGAWHALRWHNLRFYLNPLTMKLEPIAFDADLQYRLKPGEGITSEPIVKHLLDDVKLKSAFNKTLNSLNKEALNGDLARRLQIKEKSILNILHQEYFFLGQFDYKELEERAKHALIKQKEQVDTKAEQELPVNTKDFPIFVHAYTLIDAEKNYLELSNPLPYPVEVRNVFWQDKSGNSIAFESDQMLDYPLELIPTKLGVLPVSTKISYKPLVAKTQMHLYTEVNIKGYDELRQAIAKPYYPLLSTSPMPHPERKKMLEQNKFIHWQSNSTSIRLQPGSWQVNGSIVIPAGHQLDIPAGTTLQFQPDAGIISYGVTRFLGTEDAPIVLEGIPLSDGKEGAWQGMVVHEAADRSQWNFVQINNTTGISWPLWALTGGISFIHSDVDLADCTFRANKAEDALNIVHADFKLDNVSIIETTSDGFDGDFVTGRIQGGLFQDIGLAGGGDGIDFSGSEVMVDGTRFVRINDKAISAGEDSTLTVQDVIVEDSGVGAASKDRSKLKLSNSTIRNASVAGLMSYVKKSEYGPAMLVADKVVIVDTRQNALVQTGSRLVLNGENSESQDLDIENLYKTVMKPGLR